jgi:hypothetical protein
MLWAVVVLLSLQGTILVVVIIALFKYFQLSRIQEAVERAWFDDGICTGRKNELDCRLHYRDDLSTLPTVIVKSEFDRRLARRLADYVSRVEMAEDVLISPPDHEHVANFDPSIGPTFGVAWTFKESMVLAFRATVTHNEIQNDLMAWQVNFDSGERIVIEKATTAEHVNIVGSAAYVHSGFYKVLDNYEHEVMDTIGKHKPKTVYVCGHSLGGAVATLMALRISESLDSKRDTRLNSVESVVCYVYGTPRIGNAKLDERLRASKHLKCMWRVVNAADPIQDLPLRITPNFKRPHNEVFYYEHLGPAHEYYANWGSWRTSHMLPNYMSYLND